MLVDGESHEVNSLSAPGSGQLDTGNETNARGCAGGTCLGQARGRIVIGQREHAHAAFPRPRHQLRRRQYAIGKMAVGVKVDQGFGV